PGHSIGLIRDDSTHELIVCDRGSPGAAIAPLMIRSVIGAQHKYIQPIRSPGDYLGLALDYSAHELVVCDRGSPGAAIPPLVVQGRVSSQDKYVQPIRSPGHRLGWSFTDASQIFIIGH